MSLTAVLKANRLGANRLPDGSWQFLLWAPHSRSVSLKLVENGHTIPMDALEGGYHQAVVGDVSAGTRYCIAWKMGANSPIPPLDSSQRVYMAHRNWWIPVRSAGPITTGKAGSCREVFCMNFMSGHTREKARLTA